MRENDAVATASSLSFPDWASLLRESPCAFQLVLARIEGVDRCKLPFGDLVHGSLKCRPLGFADDFLDGRIDKRPAAFEKAGEFPCPLHQPLCGDDLVDETP